MVSLQPRQSESLRSLIGNEVLRLEQPGTDWEVKSGMVGVFSVGWQDGEPVGARRHLFTVLPGEWLLGCEAEKIGLLAIAFEPTELQPLADPTSGGCTLAKPQLDQWISRFSQLEHFPSLPDTSPTVNGDEHRQYRSLNPEESYQPTEPIWVKVRQGETYWLGKSTWPLDSESDWFPLTPRTGLQAVTPAEIETRATAELAPCPQGGLNQFHRYTLQAINQLTETDTQRQFQRFQARQQLNQKTTQDALSGLASLLEPDNRTYLIAETPLLIAAGAVAHALGVEVRPASTAEDPGRIKEPLEAVARASQLRLRRVLLRGQWWTQDSGPLVAYTRADHHPIALLPVKNNRYELLDPDSPMQRRPVDAALADTLDPVAFMFYRPLPEGELKAWSFLKFAFYGRQRDLWTILILGVMTTLLGMVIPQATAVLVDQAIPFGSEGLLFQLGLALLGVAIGRVSFKFAQAIAAMRLESGSDAALQAAVWDRLLKLRTSFFREYATGDLQSRVSSITAIRRRLSGSVLDALLSGGFALLNLALLFYYSVRLALLALTVALIVMVVTGVSGALLLKKQRPLLELDGELYGLMVQLINGVSKLRMAGAEGRAFAQWSEKYRQQLRLTLSTQRLEDAVDVFNTVMPVFTAIGLFWLASTLVDPTQTTVSEFSTGTFLAFNAAFAIFISGATSLSQTLIEVLDVVPLWMRSQPILTATPEITTQKADPGKLSGAFCVDHVTFRYREDGPLILDDVTVEANPGEFIALVGPSGSGKSTVMRLLLGFETPQSGTVYFDGQDLSGLDVSAVRRQLGVVLQNGRINAGSIFENISGGALISLDDAWRAAEMAGFAEDVRSFPMEMHTVISEGGGNLSGGQRQRLIIARALALNPKILLLDEATSALDNRTQAIVSESLDRLNVTRIVVAHRLSTIRNADKIYVIKAGRVVQQGSFDELAAQSGTFAQLIKRQLA
ncbi:MAG: NHLP bacteriocin export ABC transporter permease/ATPase subunit [Cyanobacteria bacterium J06648_16]